jgi:hypothetical protein
LAASAATSPSWLRQQRVPSNCHSWRSAAAKIAHTLKKTEGARQDSELDQGAASFSDFSARVIMGVVMAMRFGTSRSCL